MSDAVVLDVDETGVATLTLNRPDRMNPLTGPIADGLSARLADLEERDDVRCVVLEGAGTAFSGGGDVQDLRDNIESDASAGEVARQIEQGFGDAMARVAACPHPTVAKVDGPAVGAGATLAIACDVVLASESAVIGFVFSQVGLNVDGGTSYLLPRVVGRNTALELVLTGEVCDAERAADLGLFNHVYSEDDFETEVSAMVSRIASGPTVALRHSKRLIRDGLDKSLSEAIHDETLAQGVVFDTHDHEEGVRAFLEDREPEFEGR
mgnify:FL=1